MLIINELTKTFIMIEDEYCEYSEISIKTIIMLNFDNLANGRKLNRNELKIILMDRVLIVSKKSFL